MREGLIKIIEGVLDEIENFIKVNEEIIIRLLCQKNLECYEFLEELKKRNNIKYFQFLKLLVFTRCFLNAISDENEKSNTVLILSSIFLSILEEMIVDTINKNKDLHEDMKVFLNKLIKKIRNVNDKITQIIFV